MESESEIFSDFQSENLQLSSSSPHLIRAGKIFSYYRIYHDGKYFFFKTFTEDTSLARRLLRREFDLGSGCDNSYLPHIFLYGEFIKGKEGILMEYIDGQSLTEFMAEKPRLSERKKIFSQILDAVTYLHTKSIIHNDIKPDNILIKRTGNNVVLIDFGLSDNDAYFILKSPGCTMGYAAPELVKKRISDVRSDIYSIGKIMAFLFGNKYRRFYRKCVRENPERRYGSVVQLRKAWTNRNLPLFVAAGALVIIFFATLGWLYTEEKTERDRQLHELGVELENQKNLNTIQSAKFNGLQVSYDEVSDKYHNIKVSYQDMKDSLAESHRIAMVHEKAKTEAVEGFKAGLNKRMYATFDSIKLCPTWREMNTFRQLYDTDVRNYFNSYPKIADGEDITAELSALLQANLEEARLLFNTELPRLHK